VTLSASSEPQPDIAVLRPRPDAYRETHPRPRDVLLIIEVADTSADADRSVKLPLYASAGIREVWLVDLERDRLEVYGDPSASGYLQVRTLGRDDTATPLLVPAATIKVARSVPPPHTQHP
jgi:hypothetical protein